jgi:hypothetical protein
LGNRPSPAFRTRTGWTGSDRPWGAFRAAWERHGQASRICLPRGRRLDPGRVPSRMRGPAWKQRLRLVHSSPSFRAYDVLGLLSLTFLCPQCALCQMGINVAHHIILAKVDFTGQLFKKMRPPRAVQDRPFTSDRWKVIPPSFNRWFSDNSTNRIFPPFQAYSLAPHG